MSLFFGRLRRPVQLLVGLLCYGFAIALIVRSTLGNAPWDVLTQGLTIQIGLSFGLLQNIVGGLVLLAWIPLRQRPGSGTVLNVLLIGPSAQLGLDLVTPAHTLAWKVASFTLGLGLLALATGLYIGAQYGPGPRDGLMTGLNKRFGWPIWTVRTAIESTVVLIGWALGGNLGIGTLAFALLIGPLCHLTIPLCTVPRSSVPVRPDPINEPATPTTAS